MRTVSIIAVALLALSSGCGRVGPTRVRVSGEVKFQGKPIEDGQIKFIPQGDTVGPITIESIKDGSYSCKYAGGVPVGHHRVEIRGWNPGIPEPTAPGAPPRPQLIPERFNTKSELNASVDAAAGAVTKDFDL